MRGRRASDRGGTSPHVDSQMVADFEAAARIFGTIHSSAPPTPREDAARALADAVVRALDDGDAIGARAAAVLLLAFVERLEGKDGPGTLDSTEAKARGGRR